jgi:hypothetical protein
MNKQTSRNGSISRVRLAIVALCLTAAVCVSSVVSQAADPKPPKADKPPAKKVDKPANAVKRPKVEKPADAEKAPDPAKPAAPARPDEPAVAAILETKPETPEECIVAAKSLADLKRADLAKGFVKKILDANLDHQQLADLGLKMGLPLFVDLSVRPDLQPEALQLSNAVAAAIKARREDSKRIAALIEQLRDPVEEKRFQAVAGLQEAGQAAVSPLVDVLTDPARAADYPTVRAMLAEIGRPAIPPLVVMVEKADPKIAVEAIRALGAMKDQRDTRFAACLLRPALSEKADPAVREAALAALKQLFNKTPTPADVRLLDDAARGYFDRGNQVPADADGKTRLWQWDAAKRQCVAKLSTPAAATRAAAVSLARDAYALSPNPSSRNLYLATLLEKAAYDNGLDRPLDEKNAAVAEAKPFGVKAVEETMQLAIAHGHPAAAAAAARILGEIGNARELLHNRVGPSPLAAALQSPDRRLRMAALEAIVRLQPATPFAGSSYVPQALGFFAGSGGFPRALVGCPNAAEARSLAGRLSAAGFQVDTFTNGKELLLQAAQSPDYEVALIDMTIDRPTADLLLQQLRHDPRTASLRVGLLAKENHLDRAERLAKLDGLAKAFSRPQDEKAFTWQLGQLATLTPDEFVSFKTRQQQAARALDLLAELSRSSSNVFNLRGVQNCIIAAAYNPRLAVKAAGVLADINSTQSQQTLIEVASRLTLPLAVRQAATKAFCENTRKHGVLLTTAEIRQQFQRYYDSQEVDAPTQHLLAMILDALANVNSIESQQALVELASRVNLPLTLRQAAVQAFRQSTQRHGILLTKEEVRRQYDRYNDSEKLDKPTQHVLSLILDCLETGAPKKK